MGNLRAILLFFPSSPFPPFFVLFHFFDNFDPLYEDANKLRLSLDTDDEWYRFSSHAKAIKIDCMSQWPRYWCLIPSLRPCCVYCRTLLFIPTLRFIFFFDGGSCGLMFALAWNVGEGGEWVYLYRGEHLLCSVCGIWRLDYLVWITYVFVCFVIYSSEEYRGQLLQSSYRSL